MREDVTSKSLPTLFLIYLVGLEIQCFGYVVLGFSLPSLEFCAPLLDEDIHKVRARLKRNIRFSIVTEVLIPNPRVEQDLG